MPRQGSYVEAFLLIREQMEHRYVQAVEAGVDDPVVELFAQPGKVARFVVRIRSRRNIIRTYRRICPEALDGIRLGRNRQDGRITVIMAGDIGIAVSFSDNPLLI